MAELYDDAVQRGWFTRRPDRVRSLWLALGILLTVLGAGAVVAAAAWTSYGLVLVPVVLVGLVLAIGHRRFPMLTAKGSAILSRVLAFRRYIEAAEADRMQFTEQENIFARYLPYAIVFGMSRRWAHAFAMLDNRPDPGMVWYVSPYPFHAASFGDSMDSFTHNTSGIIVSAPAGGGGSGFSGGGGGGGGGGSW